MSFCDDVQINTIGFSHDLALAFIGSSDNARPHIILVHSYARCICCYFCAQWWMKQREVICLKNNRKQTTEWWCFWSSCLFASISVSQTNDESKRECGEGGVSEWTIKEEEQKRNIKRFLLSINGYIGIRMLWILTFIACHLNVENDFVSRQNIVQSYLE